MEHRRHGFLPLILIICLLMTTGCRTFQAPISGSVNESSTYLVREDWADDVKSSLNELIATYGINGTAPADSPYAVFDFDNTSSVFDVEEELAVYQLQVMAFALQPDERAETSV